MKRLRRIWIRLRRPEKKAWREFDGLTDEQLLNAIRNLRYALWDLYQEPFMKGRSKGHKLPGNDYGASDMEQRLELLLKECRRRNLAVPDEEDYGADQEYPL